MSVHVYHDQYGLVDTLDTKVVSIHTIETLATYNMDTYTITTEVVDIQWPVDYQLENPSRVYLVHDTEHQDYHAYGTVKEAVNKMVDLMRIHLS